MPVRKPSSPQFNNSPTDYEYDLAQRVSSISSSLDGMKITLDRIENALNNHIKESDLAKSQIMKDLSEVEKDVDWMKKLLAPVIAIVTGTVANWVKNIVGLP